MHFLLTPPKKLNTFCSTVLVLLNKLLRGAGLQKSLRFILSIPAEPQLLKVAVSLYRQNTIVISCRCRHTVSMTAEQRYKGEFHCFCGIFIKIVHRVCRVWIPQCLGFDWIKVCRMVLVRCEVGWVVLVLSLALPVQSSKYRLIFIDVTEME